MAKLKFINNTNNITIQQPVEQVPIEQPVEEEEKIVKDAENYYLVGGEGVAPESTKLKFASNLGLPSGPQSTPEMKPAPVINAPYIDSKQTLPTPTMEDIQPKTIEALFSQVRAAHTNDIDMGKIVKDSAKFSLQYTYSRIPERLVFGTVNTVAGLLASGAKKVGLTDMAKDFESIADKTKVAPVTEKVDEKIAEMDAFYKGKGKAQQGAFKIAMAAIEAISFIERVNLVTDVFGLVPKAPVKPGVAKGILGKIFTGKGTAKEMAKRALTIGSMAAVETPGDYRTKFGAAIYGIANYMTAPIANATGAVGWTAMATDTMLNAALDIPTVIKEIKSAKDPGEFFVNTLPMMASWIIFALDTKGTDINQRIKYMDTKSSDFAKLSKPEKIDFINKADIEESKITAKEILKTQEELKVEIDMENAKQKAAAVEGVEYKPKAISLTKTSIIPPSPPTPDIVKGETTGDPVVKLGELIKQAEPLRGKLEKAYTEERSKRIAEVERAIEEIGGEKGYIAALSKLKGELASPEKKRMNYESVKDKLTKSEVDELYNRTFKHPFLDNYEKITAANELTKLFSGELPTPKGLVLLEEIYGTNLIKNILAKRALGLKITDTFIDILNLPRTLLSTADMSGFLRQGIVEVSAHPIITAKAMGKTFQFAFSPKSFNQYFKDLPTDKLYPLMRKSGLDITDPSKYLASGHEEAFMSRLLQKTPIIGSFVRFSERSYSGFLTKLRVDVFKLHADEYLSRGFSPIKDIALFKAESDVVNTFTGRGSLGKGNAIAPQLNTMFFSTRLNVGRFQTFNPLWYANKPKAVRVKALKDFGKFVASGTTLLALISASGLAEVETDPKSSDFGKIKIGNTRWDIWGGFQQWVRVFSQLITGQRKNTTTGEIVSLNKDVYPFTTRKDVLYRFIEGKFAPVPALINELMSGAKTFDGEDITAETIVKEKFIPMYIQDLMDAYIEGGMGRAVGVGVPAFLGVSVQTWKPSNTSKQSTEINIPKSGKLKFNKIKAGIKSNKLKFK